MLARTGIPSQLTRSSIERCKHSRVHHWLLLQYVAVFPPAVFLKGERIEIDSKAKARSVSDRLFMALAQDAAELAAEGHFRESPDLRQRADPAADGLQQGRPPQQQTEHERTVNWLGSPALRKVVTVDPSDDSSVTATAPPAATAAAVKARGASGTTVAASAAARLYPTDASTLPANNSTAATDPMAAEEGACGASSGLATELLPVSLANDAASGALDGEALQQRSELSSSDCNSVASSVKSNRDRHIKVRSRRISEILGTAAAAGVSSGRSAEMGKKGSANWLPPKAQERRAADKDAPASISAGNKKKEAEEQKKEAAEQDTDKPKGFKTLGGQPDKFNFVA